MEFVKILEKDYKKVVPLFRQYYTQEGKKNTPVAVERFLLEETKDRELFVLKEGKRIIGGMCIGVDKDKGAEISHVIISEEFPLESYIEKLLSCALEHCLKNNVVGISTIIPRLYEPLFMRFGFFSNKSKVCMNWRKQEKDRQSSLREKLGDISEMENIADETAERLRNLRAYKKV